MIRLAADGQCYIVAAAGLLCTRLTVNLYGIYMHDHAVHLETS